MSDKCELCSQPAEANSRLCRLCLDNQCALCSNQKEPESEYCAWCLKKMKEYEPDIKSDEG